MGRTLKRVGLGIRDVRRDGNCFFRAVSDQLYGVEEYHAHLREVACDYMLRHEDTLAPFLDDGDDADFAAYVDHMRSDGVWAGNIEIHAISMVWVVNIRIHQHGKPSYDLRNHARAPAIHLFYHLGEHYASVRPLHQLHDASRVEHDELPSPRAAAPRPPPEDVNTIWATVDEHYVDLLQLVEHAEAAARHFRRRAGVDEDGDGGARASAMAAALDEQARDASDTLSDVQARVDRWRRAHAARPTGNTSDTGSSESSESSDSSASSYDSASDDAAWARAVSPRAYERRVRREKRTLFAALADADKRLNSVLERARRLRGAPAGARRPSRRREQDERRKARKTRRRKEQELAARRPRTDEAAGVDYGVGVWGAPEVAI